MSDYLIWKWRVEPQHATVGGLQNVEDAYELELGVSRAHGFPPDAVLEFDPKNKKGLVLSDNVSNLGGLLLVSRKLKELIAAAQPIHTEYLPVRINNHKGRVASDDYFVVNQAGLQDCLDLKKSKVEWNSIDKELISNVWKLVLNEGAIAPGASLFRMKWFPHEVLVRRDLATVVEESGATGVRFVELNEYPE